MIATSNLLLSQSFQVRSGSGFPHSCNGFPKEFHRGNANGIVTPGVPCQPHGLGLRGASGPLFPWGFPRGFVAEMVQRLSSSQVWDIE